MQKAKPITRTEHANAARLIDSIFELLKPPPKLSLSEWADNHRFILSTPTPWPGRWQTSRVPFMREIMESFTDPEVPEVAAMLAVQLGKTECLILNPIGYHIHVDPTWLMVMQPTTEDIKEFSTVRITGLIEDCPEVKARVAAAGGRNASNTVLFKKFTGGFLKCAAAGSARELVQRPIRVLLMDEVDLYRMLPQGHPIDLASKRQSNFWNRKKILISSPLDEEDSIIYAAYKGSTTGEWHIPCPRCQHGQVLNWDRIIFKTVTHACESCGRELQEHKWKAAQSEGIWVHRFPDRRRIRKGYQLSGLVSPWVKWRTIIDEFVEATQLAKTKDFSKLKVWKNTRMGWPWAGEGEKIDWQKIYDRREVYEAEVPDGVLLLVCAVDVGQDYVEWEVAGWGHNRERWAIEVGRLDGDPHLDGVWESLEKEVLTRQFIRGDGSGMRLSKLLVDSRFAGRHVCAWTKAHQPIAGAIQGKGGPGLAAIHSTGYTQEENARIWTLGSNALKDEMVPRLSIEEPGPAYWHFPCGPEGVPVRGYDVEFFKQLCNEKRIQTFSKEGFSTYKWTKLPHTHNEAFDLACYSFAALEIIGGKKALENAYEALHAPPEKSINDAFGAYRPAPKVQRPPRQPVPQAAAVPASGDDLPAFVPPSPGDSPFGRVR